MLTFIGAQAAANLVDAALELQTGLNLFVFVYGFVMVASERRLRDAARAAPLPPPDAVVGA